MKIKNLKVGDIIEVTNTINNQAQKFQVIQRNILGFIPIRCIMALSLGAFYSDQFYFLTHLKQPEISWSFVKN